MITLFQRFDRQRFPVVVAPMTSDPGVVGSSLGRMDRIEEAIAVNASDQEVLKNMCDNVLRALGERFL